MKDNTIKKIETEDEYLQVRAERNKVRDKLNACHERGDFIRYKHQVLMFDERLSEWETRDKAN